MVTQLFGNKDLEEDKASVEFTIGGVVKEIKDIELCIDGVGTSSTGSDFEGFRFTLSDDTQIELQTTNPTCRRWYK